MGGSNSFKPHVRFLLRLLFSYHACVTLGRIVSRIYVGIAVRPRRGATGVVTSCEVILVCGCPKRPWPRPRRAASRKSAVLAGQRRVCGEEGAEAVGWGIFGWSIGMRVRLSPIHTSWVFGKWSASRSAWVGGMSLSSRAPMMKTVPAKVRCRSAQVSRSWGSGTFHLMPHG